MKLALTVAFAVFLGTALTVAQQKTTVFGSPHDITGAGCSSCHVPHQATATGRTLLWNQDFSTQTFNTYDSPSMDSSPAEIGSGTYGPTNPPTGAVQASVLCMSCHDGVTSGLILADSPDAVGNPTNSDGLRNDHPVNMVYPTTDPGIVAEASLPAAIVLYDNGTGNTVQCGSCHNPHNENGAGNKFLRILNTNDATGLCAACHS